MKKILLGISLAGMVGSVQAADVFWRDSNDGTTGANWVNGFENGGGVTPGAADVAVISGNNVDDTTVIYVDSAVSAVSGFELRDRGATLQIRSGGSLSTSGMSIRSDFNEGNSALSIQGGSFTVNSTAYSPTTNGTNDTSRHTLSVSSGNLTFNSGGNNNNGLLQNGSNVSISGGTVDMGDAWIQIDTMANFNWTGGTIQNVNRLMGDNVNAQTLTNGGTFIVNTNTRTDDLMSFNNGTGTTVFGIESTGLSNAQLSQYSGGGVWDLTTGTVAVDFGDYVPNIDDSWDFTALAAGATGFLGSAANIAALSADGLWNITWDTSNWVSGGELGITGVAAIPEPGSFALLGGLLALSAVALRRRQHRVA
jgi:hypothetical protein